MVPAGIGPLPAVAEIAATTPLTSATSVTLVAPSTARLRGYAPHSGVNRPTPPRLDQVVELGQRHRPVAGGAVEVDLDHLADALGGDPDGVVVPGDRGLDQLSTLDADALGGAGVVDVEEVAVDRGDGAGAVGRAGQRLGCGHRTGVEVVDARRRPRSALSASARSQPAESMRSKEVRSRPGATGRVVFVVSRPPAGSTPVVVRSASVAAAGSLTSVTAAAEWEEERGASSAMVADRSVAGGATAHPRWPERLRRRRAAASAAERWRAARIVYGYARTTVHRTVEQRFNSCRLNRRQTSPPPVVASDHQGPQGHGRPAYRTYPGPDSGRPSQPPRSAAPGRGPPGLGRTPTSEAATSQVGSMTSLLSLPRSSRRSTQRGLSA